MSYPPKSMRAFIFFFALFPVLLFSKDLLDLKENTEHEMHVPHPSDLKSNWWDFYNVESNKLANRIHETERFFIEIQKSLSADIRTQMKSLCDKFLAGLKTLSNLKNQNLPLPEVPTPFPEKYPFRQWFHLGKQLQVSQSHLNENELKSNVMLLSMRSANAHLDTLFTNYLTEKKNEGVKRLADGLEAMFAKVSLEIEKIEQEHLNAKIDNQKKRIENFEKEIEHAKNRIDFSDISVDEINNQIGEIKINIDKNHAQLSSTYEAKRKLIEKESSELEIEIHSQNVMILKVDQVELKIKLMNLELQKTLVEWASGKKNQEEHLSKRILGKREELEIIKQELKDWRCESDIRLQKALQVVALSKEKKILGKDKNLLQNSLKNSESIMWRIQQVQGQIVSTEHLIAQLLNLKKELPKIFTFKGVLDSTKEGINDLFIKQRKWVKVGLFRVGNIPITPYGIFKLLVIIFLACLIAKLTRGCIRRVGGKYQGIRTSSTYILSTLTYYLIILLGLIYAGASLGLDLTAFAWIAGAVAVWVGLSLQSVFHNFISGVIILLSKSIHLHDVIVLESGEYGTVIEINLRSTILSTSDGVDIVIPNSDLVSNKFTNRTLTKVRRRVNIPFRIGLDENIDFIQKIIQESIISIPITLTDPYPEVWLLSYGDSYINCELAVWIDEFIMKFPNTSTEALYFKAIHNAFRKHQIEIPIIYHSFHEN